MLIWRIPPIGAASSGLFNEFVCTRRRDLLAPNPAKPRHRSNGKGRIVESEPTVNLRWRFRVAFGAGVAGVRRTSTLSHAQTYGASCPTARALHLGIVLGRFAAIEHAVIAHNANPT